MSAATAPRAGRDLRGLVAVFSATSTTVCLIRSDVGRLFSECSQARRLSSPKPLVS